jgi:AraC-like DNA-binding protein
MAGWIVFGTIASVFIRIGCDAGGTMAPLLIQKLVEFDCANQQGPLAVPLHVHHVCQLDVILAGSMELRTREGRLMLKKGDASLIPPLSPHGFGITKNVRHATFKVRIHPRYNAMVGHVPRIVRFDHEAMRVAEFAGPWSQSGDPLRVNEVMAAATLCLVHMLRQDSPAAGADAALSEPFPEFWKAVNGVIANPHDEWTVGRLADRCHVSEGHFSKTFVRLFGQTPQRFLMESRIWEAADRLSRGDDATIKSVAGAVGYATVHSFSRAFKQAMGVSPAAYVKGQGKF